MLTSRFIVWGGAAIGFDQEGLVGLLGSGKCARAHCVCIQRVCACVCACACVCLSVCVNDVDLVVPVYARKICTHVCNERHGIGYRCKLGSGTEL